MEKSTKRVNSYLKMVLWMAGGGALGAIIGGGSVFLSGGIHGVFQNLTDWLKGNTIVILGILLVISLILSIFCYTKIEGIVRMSKENEDDEIQDKFDQTFDFWGNIGLAGTSVIIYLSMAAYAFQMYRNMKSVKELLISSGFFLFIVIVCGFYQVAAIKQIRRKEPLKQGDAADRNFEKIWLSSCDEGEKKIIFEAGYKAFSITRIFLLVATLIAMLGETFFDGGLTAVVLLTACNIFMTLVYTYFSIKLGK